MNDRNKKLPKLEEGLMYKFRYVSQGGNYQWSEYRTVAKFIGYNQSGNILVSHRPLGGTSELRPETVTSCQEMPSRFSPELPVRMGRVEAPA